MALLLLIPAAYQLVAFIACLRQLLRRDPERGWFPSVSVMKPVHSADPGISEAIASHEQQDYPEFELLVGGTSPAAPATANGKVGALIDLGRRARYPVWVVNDADIRVQRDYLQRVVAPLADSRTGLVTCLYRARARGLAARLEGLGVATDFAPSALVAPLVGINEFGMGSTLAFRAETLARIGGFAAVQDYLADDYQIGRRISGLGLRVHLSRVVVETSLSGNWRTVWRHQVRWARTIRVSRGGGYAGLPITNATIWALAALAGGATLPALSLLALRYLTGLTAGIAVLRCPLTARLWPLMPLRDLFGFAVWCAGLFGSSVEWRGLRLHLSKDGRIVSASPSARERLQSEH